LTPFDGERNPMSHPNGTAFGPDRPFRIGTRASPLALAQAYETASLLKQAHGLGDDSIEIIKIITTGDQRLEKKLGDIGGKGLFTKEVEEALYDGSIDLAVHSMKDMPTTLPDGLEISALLPREDVRDAFVSPRHASIAAMPAGAVVGTASLRRQAQLLHKRPDLKVCLFRGNVQTRLRKLEEGEADATFLAVAGLNRLDRIEVATAIIETTDMLPAVAQGAVGIETRTDDADIRAALAPLHCETCGTRLAAERAFLGALDGSCKTPIGGLAEIHGDRLILRGEALRPDGSERHATMREGPLSDAVAMGLDAGAELKSLAGPGFFVQS